MLLVSAAAQAAEVCGRALGGGQQKLHLQPGLPRFVLQRGSGKSWQSPDQASACPSRRSSHPSVHQRDHRVSKGTAEHLETLTFLFITYYQIEGPWPRQSSLHNLICVLGADFLKSEI